MLLNLQPLIIFFFVTELFTFFFFAYQVAICTIKQIHTKQIEKKIVKIEKIPVTDINMI